MAATVNVLRKYREHAIRRGYTSNILGSPVVPSVLGDLWDEAYAAGQRDEREACAELARPKGGVSMIAYRVAKAIYEAIRRRGDLRNEVKERAL